MANQPTKYRKFVVGAASAALVASAVAPVAFAADFSDTKGNTHEEAINALSEAGVIKGYEDGTFKPNKTLTRSDVVKLMGKWLVSEGYKVPTDAQSKPRFADLKSTSNKELLEMAAVVYDNGVFVGTPDGKLDPTGDITRENMAIVIVRAFDRVHDIDLASYVADQDFKKDVTDLGKAKAEARPAIDVLDFFDITNPAAPEFNPKATTTRGHFATFLHKTINADFSDVEGGVVAPGVASVKAVNATTVEVAMKEKVDNINSLNFKIDGLTVSNAAVKQTDDKVVVLTTAVQKGGEKYTVTLNEKAIGSFTGISSVVPTKITMNTDSTQGKVGQQAILSADVGVKQAGIPVTFNVKADTNNTLNKDQVFEAVTNEEGIATFSYSQYAAGIDEVVAYPTGAPTARDYATVHWGVDTILTLEEDDTKGVSLNNGENKKYKVTYKDPKTGKAKENAKIHLIFDENVDVPVNKLTDATINGKEAYQATNDTKSVVTVTTDSKGVATFTVSGTNTKATPVAFIDNGGYTNADANNDKLDRTELNVKAKELTFGAVHTKYEMEVTRDGGQNAAKGVKNGRVYKIAVKDENGKPAAKEVVNVGLDEILDRVISTKTNAKFVVNDDKEKGTDYYDDDLEGKSKFAVGHNMQQITVELNSKGEGEFKVVSNDSNDYATPLAWIDINSANNKEGTLEEGEPQMKGSMTYFEKEKIEGSKLKVYNTVTGAEVKDNRDINGKDGAEFKFEVANQSGEAIDRNEVKGGTATFKVENTGTKDVVVFREKADLEAYLNNSSEANRSKGTIISTRRTETISSLEVARYTNTASIYVASVNGESATVEVTSYGEFKDTDDKTVNLSESKVAKATFKSTSDVGASHTGDVVKFDKNDKKLTFDGKEEIKYKEEFDAGKVKYEDARGSSTLNLDFEQFEDIVDYNVNKLSGNAPKLHYFKNNDGVITFTILEATSSAEQAEQAQNAVNAEALKITSIEAPVQDATSLTLPTVADGYSVAIKSSSAPTVIKTDRTITPPEAETTVALVLTVSKDGYTADTESINVVVPAKSVAPPALSDDTTLTVADTLVVTDLTANNLTVAAGTYTQALIDALTEPADGSFELQDADGSASTIDTNTTLVEDTMKIVVTAQDGSTQEYTITVQ
ncbi:S-layer homology domain-containing protein [Sporosarcina newyorkensis]|uniref:S-layer homology domain-containing protein n=1 Tax=Sporosarcina newyorkensis TaxID=759851 RepID=UPI003D06C106